nr:AsmA family protein [Desulfobacula sp.]
MKGIVKWTGVIVGGIMVLIIAAALIIPRVIDIKKYKPVIQEKIASATGRTFSFGDDMDVSVFPWVGVSLTDLHLGNPDGYQEKDMVTVKRFEVRLKVMPLLSRRIEVKTFVLDRPEIYLEKMKDAAATGRGWERRRGKNRDAGQKRLKPLL